MAKMKIEVLAAAKARRGLSLRDRFIAYLPRYAPYAARLAPLLNAREAIPGAAWLSERLMGFSAKRPLPRWNAQPFRLPHPAPSPRLREPGSDPSPLSSREMHSFGARDLTPSPEVARGEGTREVALLADTFNTYFEPETLHDAVAVLERLGYRVSVLQPPDGGRPLCCGRTFLSAGLVDEARTEARRLTEAARPLVARGVPIVGLEPSCLLTLRDEFLSMLPGAETELIASRALLFEEFLAAEAAAGRIPANVAEGEGNVLLHGHCHQKAFGALDAVRAALSLVRGLRVETIESSCCGMAGAFGYGAETYDVSMQMAGLSLLPALRGAPPGAAIAADGFSCRHQIHHGTGRRAKHVARILRAALLGSDEAAPPRPNRAPA
jgi:Fe-S oxidoreductase